MLQLLSKIKKSLFENPALIIVVCISFILWALFYPAYMSADSLVQYEQALSGVYEDWHPPVMAILVHYILLLGGSIATVTFMQTIFGCLGVYFLAKEILRQRNVNEKKQTWVPLYILIILLLPVSPFPFYLMHFLKDTWIAIGFIWITYLGLRTTIINQKNTKQYIVNYTALVLLISLVFITRYNAIVLVPVFFLLLFYNSKRLADAKQSVIPVILWSVLPFFVYIAVQKQLNIAFQIKKLHPENQVMALESVGALLQDKNNSSYVPYISANLTPNYEYAYFPGNVASVMNWEGSEKTLNQLTFSIADERIKKEYINLAWHAPGSLVKVKSEGFFNMLKPSTGKYWFHVKLDDNAYGLTQNETFKKARLGWQLLANNIHSITLTSFIGGEHLVWLIINVSLLILLISKRQLRSMLFIVLLIPLGYYLSYLLACTGDDFRFMYPATLLVQVIALSLLFSGNRLKRNNN